MDEDTRMIAGATLVALAGGLIALLVMTDRGRGTVRRAGPALDEVSSTLHELRAIVGKIDGVVQEAQAMIADIREALPATRTTGDPRDVPYGV